ncbi:MAG: RNA-directed DNA polymerase [Clostridium sp.]|nr:RNA-directed DNA polymerase [Clostridium sp.]
MGTESREYYSLHSYTEETYKYVINEIFDKDSSIIGYKYLRPNPSFCGYNRIANETYAFFLTHYFKAIDVFRQNEQLLKLDIEKNTINLIDIGANIGTVTFACIDQLLEIYKKLDITINIVFIEVDNDRIKILKKAIEKYIQVTKLNIKYSIIEEMYEDSVEDVSKAIVQADTIILISNLLNWITDIELFRVKLFETMSSINKEHQCNIINIETRSNSANTKLEDLYDRISEENEEIRNEYFNKRMPRFNNIKGCYYYDQKGVQRYNDSSEYYYGYIINDSDMYKTKSYEYIKKAYYKALYTARSYFLFDQLEIKYTNANLDNIISYIKLTIEKSCYINNYEYQYRIKKKKDEYRSLYLDDFVNDIINTTILITKGIKIDWIQNDEISYGNRINKDLESPYTFNNYYEQYFKKFKVEEKNLMGEYNYFYKIDLRRFYNNIDQEKMKKEFFHQNRYGDKWYDKAIESFILKKLDECEYGEGLCQGPVVSHMLANIYLNKFDQWFMQQFSNAKMIRYVDDIVFFTESEIEAKRIYKKCSKYLNKELNLEIGQGKTEEGYTSNYKTEEENMFIKESLDYSNILLKSIYKLDKSNYEKYKENPENFINNYQVCLQGIGIKLSKEWLNIKIDREIGFLDKMKNRFKDMKMLKSWLKKKEIYDIKVKLGSIPTTLTEESINKWVSYFNKNNKSYLGKLDKFKRSLDEKLGEMINEAKNSDKLSKDIKSTFKFTLNKAGIFKIYNMEYYINDIYDLFPFCNKVAFSNYSELFDFICGKLNDTSLSNKEYDYAIYIWLLGEYKNVRAINKLEKIYWTTYNNKEYFLNSLVTEALLKIGQVSNEMITELANRTKVENEYYLIRNKLLLIKNFNERSIQSIVERYVNISDERIRIFLNWIIENDTKNILDMVEDIPQSIKEKYPNYPLTNEYLSL